MASPGKVTPDMSRPVDNPWLNRYAWLTALSTLLLAGIGGVVLLFAAVWVRNEPAPRLWRRLGWLAFYLVQFQGLLGGLRVVLFWDSIGILHAALAQSFLVLVCAIAVLTSRWWRE